VKKCRFIVYLLIIISFSKRIKAQPKYEFRGVWVATVGNIDFPSDKFQSSFADRAEFVKLLDMNKRNGMNAVIVQIRPAADAFYPSQYEPWSEWLTGIQGKPPSPYFDPLQFMITETHKRGMEFHAWMNPYRAVFNIKKSSISPTHITKIHPDWFITYGGTEYFDPGNKEVQKYLTKIVRDVVTRYDVDAIHFDDYFYPYKIPDKVFNDTASFRRYGNGMNLDTWRRSNVDSIIIMICRTIKEVKPHCKFGISPFGVWRNSDKDPDGSNTSAHQTDYDDLYADILLWLRNKWIDYVAPQLYWSIGKKGVPFEVLLDWWAKHSYGRQLYIGQGIYRAFEPRSYAWKNKNELPDQIRLLRQYPQVQGSIFFSSSSFVTNPEGWCDSLRDNYYHYPAIIPPMKWIDSIKPARPEMMYDSSKAAIFSDNVDLYFKQDTLNTQVNRYVIYNFSDTSKIDIGKPQNITDIVTAGANFYSFNLQNIPSQQNIIVIAATALTNTNNESKLSRYIYLKRESNGWHVINQINNL
jgi:uncharacterized lipoprotein YddW (UPF0748 family)